MYNMDKIRQAIQQVNDFNITVTTKAYHKTKLEEVRKLLYDCMEINRYLFDPQYHYGFCKYKEGIVCNDIKKELDNRLNYCLVTIKSELVKIMNTILTCKWDEKNQCYIEIA